MLQIFDKPISVEFSTSPNENAFDILLKKCRDGTNVKAQTDYINPVSQHHGFPRDMAAALN